MNTVSKRSEILTILPCIIVDVVDHKEFNTSYHVKDACKIFSDEEEKLSAPSITRSDQSRANKICVKWVEREEGEVECKIDCCPFYNDTS